jgi:tetratricopeptide (TPR) repeat protein
MRSNRNRTRYFLALALCLAGAPAAAIVGSIPALAVDNMNSADAPDLTSVRTKIKAADYRGALAELKVLSETNQHPDVYTLMGYSLRKIGDYPTSLTFYKKALDFNADHKSAREYLGELYVETGQIEKARENAVQLKKLCPAGCEELADLEEAIAHAPPKTN